VRITVENQRPEAISGFFYQITYALEAVPDMRLTSRTVAPQPDQPGTSRAHPPGRRGWRGANTSAHSWRGEQLSNGWVG